MWSITQFIYHKSLELDFTAYNDTSCTYLYLYLNIYNDLEIDIFNKVDNFDFKVHRYSYPDSNSTYFVKFGICIHSEAASFFARILM